ncbi:MAG: dockerin type I repeat-containing protein [Ruminococcus flavefaciens]|nr:dockerin type I repeat-containing protein [Ruminococcus flavefaciens]
MKKLPVVLISIAMMFSCVSLTAVAEEIKGDINGDGVFNVSDVALFQKWLLSSDTEIKNWSNADFCEDGKLDVFDLCLMKKELSEQAKPKLSDNKYNYSLLKEYDNSNSQVSVFIQGDEALIMWKTPVFYGQTGCIKEIKTVDSCRYKSENSEIEILNSDTVYYYGETPKGYTYCVVKATAEDETTLILDCDSHDKYIDFAIDENLNISLKNNE